LELFAASQLGSLKMFFRNTKTCVVSKTFTPVVCFFYRRKTETFSISFATEAIHKNTGWRGSFASAQPCLWLSVAWVLINYCWIFTGRRTKELAVRQACSSSSDDFSLVASKDTSRCTTWGSSTRAMWNVWLRCGRILTSSVLRSQLKGFGSIAWHAHLKSWARQWRHTAVRQSLKQDKILYSGTGPQAGFKVWGWTKCIFLGERFYIMCLKQIFLGTTQIEKQCPRLPPWLRTYSVQRPWFTTWGTIYGGDHE